MKSLPIVMLCAALALSACATTGGTSGGSRMTEAQTAEIQYKALDSVNTLRGAKGLQPLQLNAQLTAAAATHSRDMSVQNRPWHFGSDGSSPIDRVKRVGYTGKMLGENISETYQTEIETLSDWMGEADTRGVIMDPAANEMGFSWYQEQNGKIWWTLVTGTTQTYAPVVAALPQG